MDGEPLPAKESLETHQASDDYKGGIWALVDVDISKLSSNTKRINPAGARLRSGESLVPRL